MMDQAEKLRQVINNLKLKQNMSQKEIANNVGKKAAKVITITSGKGGVGKTNITVNLAICLSELGYRVVILDADFGLANVDVLFGIVPKYTLLDMIENRRNIFEVLSDGPKNIKFISGGSGVEALVKLEKDQLDKFVSNIALLDKISDIILIDTGAGLSDTVMSFIMAADEVLLVTTPEPTSITDAYALIKMVSNRDRSKKIKVLVNKAESASEANDILNKLTLVSEKFLSMKLHSVGFLLHDEMVIKAVKLQQPFFLSYPKCHAARQIKEVCKELVDSKGNFLDNEVSGIKGFIKKLVNLMNT
ncbi:MAG TPA: MinD/ParA family protein [Clostridiaceae bacterium]|nr:MinD/ParA family protein [Clostridiaceae bacterium]